jgi:hypothetical protein
MAKKQNISDSTRIKFNKPQFKIGDAVYFTWLGQKKYGYVIRFKETSWGIQYTVETNNRMRYPCGIQIAESRTEYHTGCILYTETKQLGTDEITRRITQAPDSRRIATVSANSGGSQTESRIHDTNHRTTHDKPKSKKSAAGKRSNSRSNADQSSSDGVLATTKRSRKGSSALDAAIEKQRNFLNGFVNPD